MQYKSNSPWTFFLPLLNNLNYVFHSKLSSIYRIRSHEFYIYLYIYKGLISLYTIECTSVTLLARTRFSSISNFSCTCKIHTLISFYFLTSSKAIGRHIRKIPRRNTVIHEEWSSHIWWWSFFNNFLFLIRLSFKWSQNQIRDSDKTKRHI